MSSSLWQNFLDIRRELINEWRREGKGCSEIARTLSMDPVQVYLISQVETGPLPDDVRAAHARYQEQIAKAFTEGRIK